MKLAVILHIYYLEQIPDIRAKLQNLDNAGINYDLFITSPHPNIASLFSPTFPASHCELSFISPPPLEGEAGRGGQHNIHITPTLSASHCEKASPFASHCEEQRDAAISTHKGIPSPRRSPYSPNKLGVAGGAATDPTEDRLPSASQFTKFIPTFIPTENRGYDIAPFIHALKSLNLDNYDYVLKLHTKGTANTNYTKLNGRRFDNALWGKMLWDSLLKSPERLSLNIEIIQKNQNIGMLSSAYCLTSEKQTYEKFLPQINEVLQQLNLPQTNTVSFIAGTMFIAKASLLKPLQKIDESRFTPTDSKVKEGTYAHLIERVFGAVITAQNHKIYGLQHDNYILPRIIITIKRFLFQKKVTKKNIAIFKICKIPIYYKSLSNKQNFPN